jgi:NAD(P)-dependent dehydrogenase (short-subunit alcohol dehydrogenase family)
MFDLTGKVAIVTGGAGGLGHPIALGLAKAGANIVITSRTMSKLEPVAKEIKALGRQSLAIVSDITDPKSLAAMVDQVVKQFSHIDILVNIAGIMPVSRLRNSILQNMKKLLNSMWSGPFYAARQLAGS